MGVPSVFIFYESIQFSVGKSTGSPFPKLYIGICLQRHSLPEGFHVGASLFHIFSAFQQNRTEARFCQFQGTEQSGRPGSDNNGAPGKRFFSGHPEAERDGYVFADILVPAAAFQQLFLISAPGEQCITVKQFRFFPGIQGTLCDPPEQNILFAAFEFSAQSVKKLFFGMVYGACDLVDAKHGGPPVYSSDYSAMSFGSAIYPASVCLNSLFIVVYGGRERQYQLCHNFFVTVQHIKMCDEKIESALLP